jgi:hypothetical protein
MGKTKIAPLLIDDDGLSNIWGWKEVRISLEIISN